MGHKVPKNLPANGVILAEFRPGFSWDLTTWRIIIDREGRLFQEVEQFIPGITDELGFHKVEIGVDAVLDLLIKADEIGFAAFQQSYSSGLHLSDMPAYRLVVHIAEEPKEVWAEAPEYQASLGNRDVQGFMELWHAVHSYAPYPPQNPQSDR